MSINVKYFFILSLCVLGLTSTVQAQNTLPKADFLCVDNDTLKWDASIIPCGPFVEYAIFASQSLEGPYTLLATVDDPTVKQYFHDNANSANITWYYYIIVNQDCPGYVPDFSDTLDNREPNNVGFHFVTAEDSTVTMQWEASDDPSVVGYIIAQVNESGLTVLDTVFGATTYEDVTSNPNVQSWEYTLSAIDACGTTSIWDTLPQQTIFLSQNEDKCERSLTLNWTAYTNWSNGVEKYRIYVGENGLIPTVIDSVSGDSLSLKLDEVSSSFEYCFYIEAVESGTGFTSRSNEICLVPDVIQPMTEIIILETSVTSNGQVQVIWTWNTDADIENYSILSSQNDISYASFADSVNISGLNPFNETFDVLIDSLRRQFYVIESLDSCNRTFLSPKASTVVLTGGAESSFVNRLEWKEYFNESGEIMRYDVYRIAPNGQAELVGMTTGAITNFTETIDGQEEAFAENCYFVEAVALMRNSEDEIIDTSYNRSNLLCIEQPALFHMPNAFSPKGKNNIFRPMPVFYSSIEDYTFQVYDRWGQLLYETQDLNAGWNGKFNDRQMRQGVYVYYVKATQTNGRLIELKGSFVLLR